MSKLFVTTNLHHLSPTQVARQFPGEETGEKTIEQTGKHRKI